MHWEAPEEIKPHHCQKPSYTESENFDYFECDVCGKDYTFYGSTWYRLRNPWRRKTIRAVMGIDEKCPACGPRSYRNYRQWIDAQQRAGGAVMVGYSCKLHEPTHDDMPDMSLLGIKPDKE